MTNDLTSDTEAHHSSPGRGTTADRIPALDGLRGIAVLLVMFLHYGSPDTKGAGAAVVRAIASFGWAGVDLFFVLSGFLITGILLDSRRSKSYFRTFYIRRFLRIFPLYYGFLAIVVWIWGPRNGAVEAVERQVWLWTYLTNFDIVRHGWLYGASAVVNHLWSLAVEEHFYLVWPLFVLWLDRRELRWLALAGVFGAPMVRVVLDVAGYRALAAYMLTPARVDGLAVGALLAIMARDEGGLARWRVHAAWVLGGAAATIAWVFASAPHFFYNSWFVLKFSIPALSLGFGALLLLTLTATSRSWLQRVFGSRILRFYGRYSYGLYVWHPFVGRLLLNAGFTQLLVQRLIPGGALTALVTFVLKSAIATIVALCSWRLIEQPFLRLKDRVRYDAPSVGE